MLRYSPSLIYLGLIIGFIITDFPKPEKIESTPIPPDDGTEEAPPIKHRVIEINPLWLEEV